MPNEIQAAVGTTGWDVYANVTDATGQWWHPGSAAFVASSDAPFEEFDITLLEQTDATAAGLTVYAGDFPAAIPAGVYGLVARRRVTGDPLPTDPPVAAQTHFEWGGAAVVPLSSRAATGAAMTLTAGERDSVAAALLDLANGVESGKTLRQAVRLMAAALAGKRTNAGTTSEQYDAIGSPGTARIVGNLNSAGDGTPTLTP